MPVFPVSKADVPIYTHWRMNTYIYCIRVISDFIAKLLWDYTSVTNALMLKICAIHVELIKLLIDKHHLICSLVISNHQTIWLNILFLHCNEAVGCNKWILTYITPWYTHPALRDIISTVMPWFQQPHAEETKVSVYHCGVSMNYVAFTNSTQRPAMNKFTRTTRSLLLLHHGASVTKITTCKIVNLMF